MAAMQTFTIENVLDVRLEGLELDTVQFTDETFEAELVIESRSDERLTGTLELVNESELTLGSDRSPLNTSTLAIDLEPGETVRVPAGGTGLVGGTGTAILVGISKPQIHTGEGGSHKIEPGDDFVPLASLVFWDRSFYRANYLWPRRAQYLSVAIAILSAVLAGMIVMVSLS